MNIFTQQLLVAFVALATIFAPVAHVRAATPTLDILIVQVQSMMEEMAKLQVQLQELKKAGSPATPSTSGQVLGATTFKFTQDLAVGATNDDISKIQTLLKQDPLIYPEGTVSGFFGPKTVEAIRNLQKRFGLDPVGVVGPATQALLQRLISQQNTDGTYPKDILDPTRPTGSVLGVSTPAPTAPAAPTTPTTPVVTPKPTKKTIEAITYEYDGGDVEFTVEYSDGSEEDFDTEADSPKKVAAAIAEELDIDEDEVEDVLEEDEGKSNDDDEVDEITVKIRATDAVVTVYYTDDTKERFTLDETDEDDLIEAIADEIGLDEDEVEDLTEFETDFNVDEVEEINVTVYESEDTAEVSVEMEDGDDDREFEIDADDDEDEMLEDIAKELDVDADDIEDLVEFDYED